MDLLLYWNGSIYQQNNVCGVYVFTSQGQWVATTYPVDAPDPLAVSLQCPYASIPGVSSFADLSGNLWTVQKGVVYENGETAGLSYNVMLLLFYNNQVYQQTNSCGVYIAGNVNSGSNAVTWTAVQMPSGAMYQIPASVLAQCPGMGGVWTASYFTNIGPNEGISSTTGVMLSSAVPFTSNSSSTFFYVVDGGVDVGTNCESLYSGNLIASSAPLGQGQSNGFTGSGLFTPNNSNCENTLSQADSFSGTLYPGSSIQTTDDFANIYWSMAGLYSYPQVQEVYFQFSSFAAIAGTWKNIDGSVFAIDGNGVITVTGSQYGGGACVVTGQVSLMNQTYAGADFGAYNMYSITVNWGINTHGDCEHGASMTGLIYLDNTVSPSQLIGGGQLEGFDGYDGNMLIQATQQ